MNHTTALNVWKGSNRVSRLWEELAAACVTPDPAAGEWISTGKIEEADPSYSQVQAGEEEAALPLGTAGLFLAGEEPGDREQTLLEKVSLESRQWIRQALEALTAAPEEEPLAAPDREEPSERLPGLESHSFPAYFSQPGTSLDAMLRVSSEPEPQPGSVIDTRRMAYGLKIPARPLHKRPIYQRLYFCLRRMVSGER